MTKLRKVMYSVAIWVILTAPTGRAQIVAPAGRTVFNRAIMLRTFVEIRRFSLEQDSATSYINPYAAVWGFAPNWNLTAVVPFVTLHREFAPGGPGRSSTTSGLGDGLLLLKYDGLYRRNRPGGFTRLAGEFGVKLPTGNTTFGSGSTDFVFHLVYTRVSGRHWVGGDAQYVLTTEGRQEVRAGSSWDYDVFYQYRLWP
ncbi:MAG: hypothetical protein HY646_18710, partial [Acidobacteria bacterium]|nr:hypothetical protein [Acidobacteriota bacterium]